MRAKQLDVSLLQHRIPVHLTDLAVDIDVVSICAGDQTRCEDHFRAGFARWTSFEFFGQLRFKVQIHSLVVGRMDVRDIVRDHFVTEFRRCDQASEQVKLRVERLHIGAIGTTGTVAVIRTSGKTYLSCQKC